MDTTLGVYLIAKTFLTEDCLNEALPWKLIWVGPPWLITVYEAAIDREPPSIGV
jgi:hypothetical protein